MTSIVCDGDDKFKSETTMSPYGVLFALMSSI